MTIWVFYCRAQDSGVVERFWHRFEQFLEASSRPPPSRRRPRPHGARRANLGEISEGRPRRRRPTAAAVHGVGPLNSLLWRASNSLLGATSLLEAGSDSSGSGETSLLASIPLLGETSMLATIPLLGETSLLAAIPLLGETSMLAAISLLGETSLLAAIPLLGETSLLAAIPLVRRAAIPLAPPTPLDSAALEDSAPLEWRTRPRWP
ncbi:uncharacterized protein LOC131001760 [Salvia miltiorrhiza]|uniref:uncharacterized protein LOC131001760 n=1 Tax=Salvia miltiorrhiza TaxID=226208 RepID=UPI0025AC1F3C|nr:uncharacterized protein LOC131001760 [Salvia miltiorrhiza]